jgi:hypothetical protein
MSVEAWTLPRRVVDENRADPRSQVVGADELGHGKVAERCHFVVDPCRAGDWAARGLVMVRGSLPLVAAPKARARTNPQSAPGQRMAFIPVELGRLRQSREGAQVLA